MHIKDTKYGFEYGAATVERCCSDETKGWVVISVATPRQRIDIYVTKTGKIRVHSNGTEYLPAPAKDAP